MHFQYLSRQHLQGDHQKHHLPQIHSQKQYLINYQMPLQLHF